ncbi:unnamed protein product [Bursaphelenchus xylophilus]|uniref:(pine wood nematode) hypothetical protein n=1 Tax=Bursaphelenchus xylophilus TaxID=6326 RepID=A0A1I7S9D8_BURXY|nr:unnamed protein product [Bursaphelenchus xylophilus]CAG9100549.1 unnamed protein product [Bursaphelenchus xylophilus]
MMILFLFAILIAFVHCDIRDDHEIKSLPGLTVTPKFKQYAGYLNVSTTRKLSYWLVESQNNTDNDPLLLWLNGGPGCSSFFGTIVENGPFRLDPGDDVELVLKENPHAYNTFANVLYLESPAGVGFSVNENPDFANDDNTTAIDNLTFLKAFLEVHTNFKGRDFYISGFSYAGAYVPTLAEKVLEAGDSLALKLKGLAMGNAVTKNKWLDKFSLPAYAFHGLRGSLELGEWMKNYCPTGFDNYCGDEIENAPHVKDDGVNEYDISQKCGSDLACAGNGMNHYFNQPEVKKALHFDDKPWVYCGSISYTEFYDMEPIVRGILDKKIKVLYFYGNLDTVCPFIEGDLFTRKIGEVGVEGHWFVDGNYAGTKTVYPNNLIFTTIAGAGHPTALGKPKQMANVLRKFINDISDWNE